MKPADTPKPRGSSKTLYFAYIFAALVAAFLITPWIKPISFNWGDKTYTLQAKFFPPVGRHMPVHSGFSSDSMDRPGPDFDGPTHYQFYEFVIRNWGYGLDVVEDPAGAAQRKLPKTISGLVAALDSKNRFTRELAARELGKRGAESIPVLPALISRFQSDNEELLTDPVQAIATADLSRSLPVLTNALLHENPSISERVANVLGGLGTNALPAIPAIAEALTRNSPALQILSALALSKIDSNLDIAIPVLARLVTNQAVTNRAGAAYTIGEFSTVAAPAVPNLELALKDSDKDVRAMAARTLGLIGPPARSAIPLLISNLNDDDHDVLRWTMGALGQLGPGAKAAIPRLSEFVNHEMWGLDRASIEALGGLGPDAVPVLLNVLTNEPNKNHGFAAFSLAKIGFSTNALPTLIGLLDSESNRQVYYSLKVLAHYGPAAKPAMPKILQLMKNDDENMRLHAARAAWQIDYPKAQVIPLFIAALHDHSTQHSGSRVTATLALGEIGSEASEALPFLQFEAANAAPGSHNSMQDDAQTAIDRITGHYQDDGASKLIGPFLK